MEATLETVRRRPVGGEETEVLRDVPCEADTDAGEVRIRTDRDVDIQIGDELESDAFEWPKTVRSVRKERTEEGYRITLAYA